MERVILHADINGCFANIELLFKPELRGLPVAVGGDVEQRHGIILAKSQECKQYGVKTGEAIWQAKAKCPGLVVLPPNYKLYLKFSHMVRDMFLEYTDQVEPFGIDEAWLDVTGSTHLFGTGEHIAEDIRRRVKEEIGITVSVGVSYNKIFAKLGSDYKKPDAVTVFTRENYREKVWPLPVEDLLGVGHATKRKLNGRGIGTIGGIAKTPPDILQGWFGKWGLILHSFANGRDEAPVKRMGEEAVVKGVGNSTTTQRDLMNELDCKIVFYNLAESVAARLREHGLLARTVQISLRDNTLISFERQIKLMRPTSLSSELCAAAMKLLQENYNFNRPLRSIGIRVTDLSPEQGNIQLTLFGDETERERRERLERTVDNIRLKYGHYAIGRAIESYDKTLRRFDAKTDHVIHPVGYF